VSLYTQLQAAKSEEDVKDAYIKALGLKGYTKGLIDIQSREIWFEAKDTARHSSYAMFTQLLHYVQVALNKGEHVPPFLAVIDTEKAAIMKSADVLPFLAKKTVKWGKSASQFPQEALDEISAYIGTYFVSFRIKTHEDEFISTVKAAIQSGDITVRDQYKLNRPDVGWYQIRNAQAERNKSGDTAPVNFKPFEVAYEALTQKLRPQVFSLGFLR
jgi:hypothetical protein